MRAPTHPTRSAVGQELREIGGPRHRLEVLKATRKQGRARCLDPFPYLTPSSTVDTILVNIFTLIRLPARPRVIES
jgi:hypothetical protein